MSDKKTEKKPLPEKYQPVAEIEKKGYQAKIDADKARPEGQNPPTGGSNVQPSAKSKKKD